MSRRVEFVWPDELVERVDSARGDVSRSKFVQRALEKMLGDAAAGWVRDEHGQVVGQKPPAQKVAVALEVRDAVQRRNAEKTFSCPKAGCIYVSDSPGVCVHHRTERLR